MSNQNQNGKFFPNQKRITTHKEFSNGKLVGAGGSMIVAYWSDVCAVAKRTGNPVCAILWEYIFKNENEYIIGLSQEDFKNMTGIGKTAYDKAVKALVDYGYLKLREGSKVHYDFIPYPKD